MPNEIPLDPPIVVVVSGTPCRLTSVGQVLAYLRYRHEDFWQETREAARVAAQTPSEENISRLRDLAAKAFERDAERLI
jgi:hypothetical protein